jgi:DNA-binding transcriptional ArsR family regulator
VATTCPACGHAFGGKKQEQKIDRKETLAAYDRLREVQQDILFNLYRFTFLSLQQVADTFFDATEKNKRKELAGKHLAVLRSAGLVIEEQRRDQHSKKFYSPSREGMFVCQVEEKQDARKVKRVRESQAHVILSSIHANHRQGINDVMTSFLKAERHGLGELTYYAGDREVTYIFSSGGSRRRLQPDSTFLWSADGKGCLAWLEFENSRACVADLEDKVKKYLGLLSRRKGAS